MTVPRLPLLALLLLVAGWHGFKLLLLCLYTPSFRKLQGTWGFRCWLGGCFKSHHPPSTFHFQGSQAHSISVSICVRKCFTGEHGRQNTAWLEERRPGKGKQAFSVRTIGWNKQEAAAQSSSLVNYVMSQHWHLCVCASFMKSSPLGLVLW